MSKSWDKMQYKIFVQVIKETVTHFTLNHIFRYTTDVSLVFSIFNILFFVFCKYRLYSSISYNNFYLVCLLKSIWKIPYILANVYEGPIYPLGWKIYSILVQLHVQALNLSPSYLSRAYIITSEI